MKKVLSIVLTVALWFSLIPSDIFGITASAAYDIWDGESRTAPIDSDNDGVYEITNTAELAYAIYNDGTINGVAACSFILTKDIYINDPTKVNWKTGEAIHANYSINSWFRYWKFGDTYSSFAGAINGDGHTVYGLYFNMPNEGATQYDAAALIPGVAANAAVTIKNLGVDNVYVNYTNGAAAFVGYAQTGATLNINNSFAGENVTLIGNDAGVFRAVARENKDCVLENCYSLATTTGNKTYGLIGFNWEVSNKNFIFRNCYNANGPLNFGGGPGWYCLSENSYSTADNVNEGGGNWLDIGSNWIAVDKMQGLDVFTNASKMPNLNTGDAYEAVADGYPTLKVFNTAEGDAGETPGAGGEEPTPVPDSSEKYYTYEITDGKATITSFDSSISGDITIPSTLGGHPVTSIGRRAFYLCKNLTSITIPDSVTSIGSYAFYCCYGLSNVTIGNGVTQIDESAFYECEGLKSITMGNGIISIGYEAFYGCYALDNVYISDIASWCNIDFAGASANPTYYGDLYVNGSLVEDLVIPEGVTRIADYAFKDCYRIKKLTISNSVTSIGEAAFSGCCGLTSITVPDSVTSIGEAAFSACYDLISVTMGSGVKTVGEGAFYNCDIARVFISDIAAWCAIDFVKDTYSVYCSSQPLAGGVLYLNNELVTDLVIPYGVTNIGAYAFYGYKILTSVTIPDSVKNIEECAFFNCEKLTNITIPNSVTSIGDNAFRSCESLISVTIPDSVTSIGYTAFYECTGLTSVIIPDRVTSIGYSAFGGCRRLKNINIPNSITSIKSQTFMDCTSLTNITIPNSVTSIGEYAFSGCSGLTSITIPDGVTSIDRYAFASCYNLTSITIPLSVTHIDRYAFDDYIKTVFYPGTQEEWVNIDNLNIESFLNTKIVSIEYLDFVRTAILNYSTDNSIDFNNDSVVDICDSVYLALKLK